MVSLHQHLKINCEFNFNDFLIATKSMFICANSINIMQLLNFINWNCKCGVGGKREKIQIVYLHIMCVNLIKC